MRLESELTEMPAKISHQKAIIEKCRLDLGFYTANRRDMDKEERQNIRSALFRMIGENLLMPTERVAMTYQGFSVVLPTNMTSEKPYVWLTKNGKYYIEMGDAEVGVLIRLDIFLDGLSRHLEKLEVGLTELIAREKALKEEIAKKEDYTDRIAKIKTRLAKIDKELGVTENE